MSKDHSTKPRVLVLDFSGVAGSVGGEDLGGQPVPELAGISQGVRALGGAALAADLMLALDPSRDPFILSVGAAVVRGLPTAARTTVSARSPLDGGLAEGQVGSELGRRLASVWDALVLLGEFAGGDGVLVVDGEARARLYRRPDMVGLSAGEKNAQAVRDFGPGAGLSAGPAARAGIRHAHLAAGHDPPSFVGRGGLGRALAQHGLLGIHVLAEPVPSGSSPVLSQSLTQSPRLQARSMGGTLELFDAEQVQGGVDTPMPRTLDPQRHGCKGCPTPCGIVLGDGRGPSQGTMRFSALSPLLGGLAMDSEHAQKVLEVCNRLGLDAREAARDLTDGGPMGDVAQVTVALEELVRRGAGPPRSPSTRSASTPMGQVGSLASARGVDPMRSFPFLGEGGFDPARLLALAPDITWPKDIGSSVAGAGKGSLAAWHEDLVAAVDALGFCSFSAAGLLADGVMSLDQLAVVLVPALEGDAQPGVTLRKFGGEIARAAHQLLLHWGAPPRGIEEGGDEGLSPLLREYRCWRGLDSEGRPTLEPSSSIDFTAIATLDPAPSAVRVPGWVEFRSRGLLAEHLGSSCRIELNLPAAPREVLVALAGAQPDAAWLLHDRHELPLPAIWRRGVALGPETPIQSGDELDLVLVVPGG